jgi:hypothetical protein
MSQLPATFAETPRSPLAADPALAGGGGNLSAIIRRIEDAIDLETSSLRKDTKFDLAASNARKSRYLYDLNKVANGLSPRHLSEEHRDGLRRLRAKLEENEQTILAHLGAVKEVAGMLQDAIQRAETDGTYSASEFSRR